MLEVQYHPEVGGVDAETVLWETDPRQPVLERELDEDEQ
jgi:hypothetical protein